MFCGKCGAKLEDNVKFCAVCGAKVNAKSETPAAGKNRKVGMIAVAAVLLVAIILVSSLFGGGYKKTVNKFMDAFLEADAETMVELIPKKSLEAIMDEFGYDKDELDDLIDNAEDVLEFQVGILGLFAEDDLDISYRIEDATDLPKEIVESRFGDYKDDFDIKVSAAKEVEVELTIKMGKDKETESLDVTVVKVGGSWYIDPVILWELV